jgi:hypothetical protein
MFASILYHHDLSSFDIYLTGHTVDKEGVAKISSLDPFDCTVSRDEMARGITVRGSEAISCRRPDIHKAIDIVVNYPAGYNAQSLYVPAFQQPSPSPVQAAVSLPRVWSYTLCMGDGDPRGCPASTINVSCQPNPASAFASAKDCSKFKTDKIWDKPGGRCGYYAFKLTCSSQ